MISPRDLLTKNIDELRQMVHTKKAKHPERKERERVRDVDKFKEKHQGLDIREKEKEREKNRDKERKQDEAMPMEEDTDFEPDVITLQGHQSEVFICAWSPTEPLLASGWELTFILISHGCACLTFQLRCC
jgi:hypothetical protein